MTIENGLPFSVMTSVPEPMFAYDVRQVPGVLRTRNHSGGSTGSQTSSSSVGSYGSDKCAHDLLSYHLSQVKLSQAPPQPRHGGSVSSDRSSSTSGQKNVNPTRYKTEMCRPFEESGHCKYGDKCQFAHGQYELRNLSRHPKYKTEMCRTFHTVGICPYGPRCHFVHNEDELKLTEINHMKHQHMLSQVAQQVAQQQQALSRMALPHPPLPEACKPLGPMPPRFSQLLARPQSLDCGLVSLIPGAMELRSMSLPMSLSLDSPPASITDGSSPSLSPTSMLSDDVFGVPTPPPGFSALPAPAPVFNFSNVRSSTPINSVSATSQLDASPSSDQMASLVTGLQAASIAPRRYSVDEPQKDANAAFNLPYGGAPLTPPSSVDSFDDSMNSESPDGSAASAPRLPIFSMLSTFTEVL